MDSRHPWVDGDAHCCRMWRARDSDREPRETGIDSIESMAIRPALPLPRMRLRHRPRTFTMPRVRDSDRLRSRLMGGVMLPPPPPSAGWHRAHGQDRQPAKVMGGLAVAVLAGNPVRSPTAPELDPRLSGRKPAGGASIRVKILIICSWASRTREGSSSRSFPANPPYTANSPTPLTPWRSWRAGVILAPTTPQHWWVQLRNPQPSVAVRPISNPSGGRRFPLPFGERMSRTK